MQVLESVRFIVDVIKHSGKGNLRVDELFLAWGSGSSPAERSRWQVWEVAGDSMPTDQMRSNERMHVGTVTSLLTPQGLVLSIIKIALPTTTYVIMPVLPSMP